MEPGGISAVAPQLCELFLGLGQQPQLCVDSHQLHSSTRPLTNNMPLPAQRT